MKKEEKRGEKRRKERVRTEVGRPMKEKPFYASYSFSFFPFIISLSRIHLLINKKSNLFDDLRKTLKKSVALQLGLDGSRERKIRVLLSLISYYF